jgi:hypothetical protein
MSLIFRPSAQYFLEYAQGLRDPRRAYLICGSAPKRYCVGMYEISVGPDKTVLYTSTSFERMTFRAPYDFCQLTFYDLLDQEKLLAHADTRPVRKDEVIQLDLLSSLVSPGYEGLLEKVISA